jgi:6-pyruvoyltetrahydropterin/6-carboxytetrahydropterin synthase
MPKYRIGKRFTFEAAHHLPSLPAGHKCRQFHGHSYTAEFILKSGTLAGPGFVTDFADLAPVKTYIDSALDHHDLNEVLDLEPTSEVLAEHLASWFADNLAASVPGTLEAVRISETPTSWAEYRPGGSR